MVFPLVPLGLFLDNLSVQNRTAPKRRQQMYFVSFAISSILLTHSATRTQHRDHSKTQLLPDGQTGRQNPCLVQNGIPFLLFFQAFPATDAPAWEGINTSIELQSRQWTLGPEYPSTSRQCLKSAWLPLDFTFFSFWHYKPENIRSEEGTTSARLIHSWKRSSLMEPSSFGIPSGNKKLPSAILCTVFRLGR